MGSRVFSLTVYLGLFERRFVTEGMERLIVYQVSAEDKSPPVVNKWRQLGVIVLSNN